MGKVPYAQAMGFFMHTMICIRPDIYYRVGLISQFQSNLGETHWQAIKRIMRYLKGTKNYKLGFGSSKLDIIGFNDAIFVGDPNKRKSTSGHVFLFGGGIISWSNKKQMCVARYTMDSKFITCNVVAKCMLFGLDVYKRFETRFNKQHNQCVL